MVEKWPKIQLIFNILLLGTLITSMFFVKDFNTFIIFIVVYTVEIFIYAIFYFIVRIRLLKK